ncbi:MAG: hypothetical protein WC755_01425 [Candidatus Woesearchaeota archaeon]
MSWFGKKAVVLLAIMIGGTAVFAEKGVDARTFDDSNTKTVVCVSGSYKLNNTKYKSALQTRLGRLAYLSIGKEYGTNIANECKGLISAHIQNVMAEGKLYGAELDGKDISFLVKINEMTVRIFVGKDEIKNAMNYATAVASADY